jgi:hypothetical protein
MSDNQSGSDAAWATWAASVITNHGSSLASYTSPNNVAYTSTGGLVAGFLASVWGSDVSVGSQQAVNDRNLGNGNLLTQMLQIKRNYP